MPHVEIKIVDPVTGLVVPTGAPGEFCTRGYSVMLGYWEEPERTAEAIDAGGLDAYRGPGGDGGGRVREHRRPDQGSGDPGRREPVSREIEEFLFGHPDIEDVSVIGVPDTRYGEELMAWIRMRPGAAPLDAAAVREFCSGRIAHQKIPRYVKIVDAFPMTVTGKIRKVEMRQISVHELGLQRAEDASTA